MATNSCSWPSSVAAELKWLCLLVSVKTRFLGSVDAFRWNIQFNDEAVIRTWRAANHASLCAWSDVTCLQVTAPFASITTFFSFLAQDLKFEQALCCCSSRVYKHGHKSNHWLPCHQHQTSLSFSLQMKVILLVSCVVLFGALQHYRHFPHYQPL